MSDDGLFSALWRAGDLRFKLRPYQAPLYRDITEKLWGLGSEGTPTYLEPTGEQRRFILEIHRKFGKSVLCGLIASELCVIKPGARVYWGAETQKQVTGFLLPIMQEYVLDDCPDDLRPKWRAKDSEYVWPNGSKIILGGCEDEAKCNRLRGPQCDLFIIDEAGQVSTLDYLYRSVVLWMTSRTGGRVLIPSSPATSPGHSFTSFCIKAESGDGGYAHRDIYQSDMPQRVIEELMRECGGEDTAAWRREGLALREVDSTRAILPEFTTHKKTIVEVMERPDYFDTYEASDIGWDPDLTFHIFGYYDYTRAVLIIEDEIVLARMTTDVYAAAIKAKREELWGAYWDRLESEWEFGEPEIKREPYRSVGDVPDLVVADLSKNHGLHVEKTAKHDKHSAINDARVLIRDGRLRIHPRCKQLIAHCEAGIWNQRHSSYDRIEGFGHFDGCDATIYLVRNLDQQHDPAPRIPVAMRKNPERHHIRPLAEADPLQSLADLFVPNIGA